MAFEKLLRNPAPKYWSGYGERCYVAVDNAHGGMTYCGEIDRKCDIDGRDGYVFKYMSPDAPGVELTENLPAEYLFQDWSGVEKARSEDHSIQYETVRNNCRSVQGLVAFLITRASMPEGELAIILEQVAALGLKADTDSEIKKEGL